MNRRQRRVKHKRRVHASQPGQSRHRVDPRVELLEFICERARRQRKGKTFIVNQMNKQGYAIRDGEDHKEASNYFHVPAPSLKQYEILPQH